MPSLLFVIFGWSHRSKEYGETLPTHCSRCDNETYYHLRKTRRWFKLYFVPVLPFGTANRRLVCDICGAGVRLDRSEWKAAKSLSATTDRFLAGDVSEDAYTDEVDAFRARIGVEPGGPGAGDGAARPGD